MQNRLLALFSDADRASLAPKLSKITLAHGRILYQPDDIIDKAYFPTSALVSLVVPLEAGYGIETAMVGSDGVVGGASAVNGQFSINQAVVQIPGEGFSIDAADLRRLARGSAEAHALIAGHEKVALGQSQQSPACNAAHLLPERLAKWLLLARDRVGTDRLQLTQEFIAEMVGVRRTSVTVEAHQLQQAGLIRYRRGFIEILKPDELKEAACECYQVITRHFGRLCESPHNISDKENKS